MENAFLPSMHIIMKYDVWWFTMENCTVHPEIRQSSSGLLMDHWREFTKYKLMEPHVFLFGEEHFLVQVVTRWSSNWQVSIIAEFQLIIHVDPIEWNIVTHKHFSDIKKKEIKQLVMMYFLKSHTSIFNHLPKDLLWIICQLVAHSSNLN